MKTEAFEELADLADIGTNELSSAAEQDRADVIRLEARAELERRNDPVTIDRLMKDADDGVWLWYARLDGGVETRVRDDLTVVVRWTPDPGYPDRAYAVIHSYLSNVRCNLDCMHDLDELIRVFSIPQQRKTVDVLE